MPFVNPYNFVRFQPLEDGARQPPLGHGAGVSELNSGRLTCRIVALSPMMIPSHKADDVIEVALPLRLNARTRQAEQRDAHKIFRRFFHYEGGKTAVIPGSSLKGLVRSVAEALGNGCVSEFAGQYKRGTRLRLPRDLQACDENNALCVTCRLFGMPTGEGGDEGLFYKGNVAFDDAICLPEFAGKVLKETLLPELSEPKPRHEQFYEKHGIAAGRKFYYHRQDMKIMAGDARDAAVLRELRAETFRGRTSNDGLHRTATVRPVPRRTTFEFTVTYENLTDGELALLIEAIELEPNLAWTLEAETGRLVPDLQQKFFFGPGVYHKLGYGKPAGLGSAAIYIIEAEQFDWRRRYAAAADENAPLKGVAAHDWVQSWKRRFRGKLGPGQFCGENGLPQHVRDLFCILRWPLREMAEIRYPDRRAGEFEDYLLPEPGGEPQR